jgi:uncharacterized membrane protein
MSERGDRWSDKLAKVMGSWKFVIGQAVFLAAWFAFNGLFGAKAPDPYPFILANLIMSAQAAFTAPIIMMSQNRAASADRTTITNDLEADRESLEILRILKQRQDEMLEEFDNESA